jgi:hypothetical protein
MSLKRRKEIYVVKIVQTIINYVKAVVCYCLNINQVFARFNE